MTDRRALSIKHIATALCILVALIFSAATTRGAIDHIQYGALHIADHEHGGASIASLDHDDHDLAETAGDRDREPGPAHHHHHGDTNPGLAATDRFDLRRLAATEHPVHPLEDRLTARARPSGLKRPPKTLAATA